MTHFRIKASMKENWRYIVFQLLSNNSVSDKDVVGAVTTSLLRMFGEVGASKTNIWLVEYDANAKTGIVRCSHNAVQEVVAAMTAILKVNEQDAAFIVKGVSGTIKKATGKYLKK